MATKRMFSREIVESDFFLDMGVGSRCLYYELAMHADSKGFVSPKKVMRMTGATVDDLNVLIAKKFVIPFESGVVVITHWNAHNNIRLDRESPSQFVQELKLLTENKEGKYELLEDSWRTPAQLKGTELNLTELNLKEINTTTDADGVGQKINEIIKLFKPVNPSFAILFKRIPQREATKRMLSSIGEEKLTNIIVALPRIITLPYAPRATTPMQLEEKMGQIITFVQQQKNKSSTWRKNYDE